MVRLSSLVIISLYITNCYGTANDDFTQAMAKVIYVNEKFVTDVKVWTYRESRNSSYLTSGKGTLLKSWADNVTIIVNVFEAKHRNIPLINLHLKIADGTKQKWLTSWLKKYSNVPISPIIPPGHYYFNKVEIPPKGIPILLQQQDYYIQINIIITKTKVPLVVSEMLLLKK